jgi:hypothetical protein
MPEFKRRDFLKAGTFGVAAAGASLAAPGEAQQYLDSGGSANPMKPL